MKENAGFNPLEASGVGDEKECRFRREGLSEL